jgi:hypothetical protein
MSAFNKLEVYPPFFYSQQFFTNLDKRDLTYNGS